METFIKVLKIFNIVGAVVIVGGTGTLIWMLAHRHQASSAGRAGTPPTVQLPAGARITALGGDATRLWLLVEGPGGSQSVLGVDPASGAAAATLRAEPTAP